MTDHFEDRITIYLTDANGGAYQSEVIDNSDYNLDDSSHPLYGMGFRPAFWQYTPLKDGTLVAISDTLAVPAEVRVYVFDGGPEPAKLRNVTGGATSTPVHAGVTYYIMMAALEPATQIDYKLDVSGPHTAPPPAVPPLPPPPPHDYWAERLVITIEHNGDQYTSPSIDNAERNINNSSHPLYGKGFRPAFWEYTPQFDGIITYSDNPGPYLTPLSTIFIFDGGPGVGSLHDISGGHTGSTPVLAGVTYYILVGAVEPATHLFYELRLSGPRSVHTSQFAIRLPAVPVAERPPTAPPDNVDHMADANMFWSPNGGFDDFFSSEMWGEDGVGDRPFYHPGICYPGGTLTLVGKSVYGSDMRRYVDPNGGFAVYDNDGGFRFHIFTNEGVPSLAELAVRFFTDELGMDELVTDQRVVVAATVPPDLNDLTVAPGAYWQTAAMPFSGTVTVPPDALTYRVAAHAALPNVMAMSPPFMGIWEPSSQLFIGDWSQVCHVEITSVSVTRPSGGTETVRSIEDRPHWYYLNLDEASPLRQRMPNKTWAEHVPQVESGAKPLSLMVPGWVEVAFLSDRHGK